MPDSLPAVEWLAYGSGYPQAWLGIYTAGGGFTRDRLRTETLPASAVMNQLTTHAYTPAGQQGQPHLNSLQYDRDYTGTPPANSSASAARARPGYSLQHHRQADRRFTHRS